MFFIIIQFQFKEKFYKQITTILIILMTIQVPTALVKMMIYGRSEWAIGTYAYFGGGMTTILMLFVLSGCLGFYLYEKARFIYLFYLAYFQLFYYACTKRAYPMFAAVIFPFLLWQSGSKNVRKVLPFTPILGVALVAILLMSPELKDALDNPKSVFQWAREYTYQQEGDETSGRIGVIEYVFDILKEKPVNLMLGLGPGLMTEGVDESEESFRNQLPIYYGFTEFSNMSVEYGYVGVIFFLWMIIQVFRMNQRLFKQIRNPYWKSVSFAYKGIWLTCMLSFFYNPVFRLDLSAFFFWFLAAMIFSVGTSSTPIKQEASTS
jgi:hypothetical protein